MIFNTHSHVQLEPDYKDKIQKCLDNGVTHILLVGYNLETSLKAVEIAQLYPNIYASVGIHPSELDRVLESDYQIISDLLENKKVIALGEVGLDYHYKENPTKEKQILMFNKFIDLANHYHKPVIIHVRDASDDAYTILKNNPLKYHAVLHCFSGNTEDVERFKELGLYFGFGGYITFKNALVSQLAVKATPLDKILIETDDPYLTPVPFRGQRNEPSNVTFVLEMVANLLNIEKNEIAEKIFKNTINFFNLKD